MYFLEFTWNPLSGIDIYGNFKLHFYSLTWVAAFAVGYQIMKYIFKREKVNIEYLDPLFITTLLATMIGARLGHVIFYQSELITQDFLSIFLPFQFNPTFKFTGFQGLASHGAAFGIVTGLYLYRRKYTYKTLMWLMDRVVLTVAAGGVFIRFGNFINSEIIGKITNSPLGVRFIQEYYHPSQAMKLTGINDYKKAYDAIATNPKFANLLEAVPFRHPAQLYESISYIFVFLILWLVYKSDKSKQQGFLFGLFFALLWSVRFVIEFWKEAQVDDRATWSLNTGQWLSIPFILLGFYFMFVYKAKTKLD